MKKLILIAITGALFSCAPPIISIDQGLQQSLTNFINYGQQYGFIFNPPNGLVMEFNPASAFRGNTLFTTEIGECDVEDNEPNTVRISSDFWATATDTSKEILTLHELGHCLLNRNHDTNLVPSMGNIPESIMYPTILTDYEYLANKNYYLQELFTHPNK